MMRPTRRPVNATSYADQLNVDERPVAATNDDLADWFMAKYTRKIAR